MAQLTARTSTIFIATSDDTTKVYRSVEDVPLPLRQKLLKCTRGMNSATILIADKQGREELVRALQGRPSEVQCRLVDNMRSRQPEVQAGGANAKPVGIAVSAILARNLTAGRCQRVAVGILRGAAFLLRDFSFSTTLAIEASDRGRYAICDDFIWRPSTLFGCLKDSLRRTRRQ